MTRTDRRRVPVLFAAIAALLALFGALALPATTQAQDAGVLVSNIEQTDRLGGSRVSDIFLAAQSFSVPSGGDYTLTSIEIVINTDISSTNIGSMIVSIWSADASGHPASSLHTLTNPASITENVAASFTAPAGSTLAAGNTYVVMVDYDVDGTPYWSSTDSDSEDATSVTDWTISDTGLWRQRVATSWSDRNYALFLRVNGTAVGGGTPSSDAMLSALTVTAGGTDLVTFASDTETYTAMVANDVAEVTVTATKNDSGASIEYLDGDDAALDDADTGVDGHQVTLAEGDNVIKVKVTAADSSTKTYTVTVTRAAAELPADTTTTGEVDVGSSVTGNIDTDGDTDWFRVELEADKRYQIDVEGAPTGRGTLPDPGASLYDASGTSLGVPDDNGGVGNNARVIYMPTASGTYYVQTSDPSDQFGTYTLSVIYLGANGASEADTDFPVDTTTTGRVEVGGSVTGNVNSTPPNDRDWFAVELEAGKSYQIDLEGAGTGRGTLQDPYLRGVYDASGSKIPDTDNDDVDTNSGNYNSRVIFTPTTTGTYYLQTSEFDNKIGTYTLSVRDVTPSSDATLSALTVTAGGTDLVTFASDTETYTAMVANDVAEVTVTAMTIDSGATVAYLDGDDATITDAGTGVDGHQVTLAEGDNVIKVKVTAADTTTKTYTVTVSRAACTLNTGDLWCGVVTVGTSSDGVGFVAAETETDTDVGALTDNNGDQTITIESDTYTISSVLILTSGAVGALAITLDTKFPTGDVATLEFDIGSKTFKVSEASVLLTGHGYYWLDSGLTWSDGGPNVTLRLRRTAGASSDATLSGLTVTGGGSDLVTFASGTKTYTAMVASDVAEVTVTPTTTDTGATVAYLDGDDATITDAGTDAGHQVTLAVGDNVIKVKVTAEDGNATDTYTVTVSRAEAASTCTLNTGDLWCGVVTVGTSSDGVGFVAAETDTDTDVGALTDNNGDQTITIGSDTYTISSVLVLSGARAGTLAITLDKSFPTDDVNTLEFYTDIGTKTFKVSEATAYPTGYGYFWADSDLTWSDGGPNVTLRLRRAATLSMDATLSGLTVTAGGTDLVTFASGTKTYTAMVASAVAEVTVTAETTDSGATVAYLDGDDATITDADTGVDGHQVTLAEGDNVIKVKVTAEDTNATVTV